MFPRDLRSRSERDLARTFGPEFAERVFALPAGSWQGPIASAYGEHLVFVHARTSATLPPLDVVRSEVRESLLAERGQRALRALLHELRATVSVRVEGRDLPVEAGG
jgi:parvulin-like peptidyl-prolyl isomerase